MDLVGMLANDNYIVVNRDLIAKVGLRQAVLFSELCSEQNYWNKQAGQEEQWFFSTQENIERNTGLSPYEQREALKVLEGMMLIEKERRGIPCKMYYRICLEQVVKIFNIKESNSLTSIDKDSEYLIKSNNIKNNKEKRIKDYPSIEEIEQFCKERNNGVDPRRVYDYYTSANWKDSKGNPVRNWKQKIIAVWEKPTDQKGLHVAHEAQDYSKDFNEDGSFRW